MSVKWNGKTCPVCGVGTLHDEVRKESVRYRGRAFELAQPGAYCDKCGDGITYRDAAAEKAWKAFRDSVNASEQRELAQIRKRLGLTQRQAAELSGGGHNAFSRYERGEAQPVTAVVNLFRVLDRHPELLIEFGVQPEKQTIATWQAIRGREKSGLRTMKLVIQKDSRAVAHRHFGAILQGSLAEDVLTANEKFNFPSVPPAFLAKVGRKSSRY